MGVGRSKKILTRRCEGRDGSLVHRRVAFQFLVGNVLDVFAGPELDLGTSRFDNRTTRIYRVSRVQRVSPIAFEAIAIDDIRPITIFRRPRIPFMIPPSLVVSVDVITISLVSPVDVTPIAVRPPRIIFPVVLPTVVVAVGERPMTSIVVANSLSLVRRPRVAAISVATIFVETIAHLILGLHSVMIDVATLRSSFAVSVVVIAPPVGVVDRRRRLMGRAGTFSSALYALIRRNDVGVRRRTMRKRIISGPRKRMMMRMMLITGSRRRIMMRRRRSPIVSLVVVMKA